MRKCIIFIMHQVKGSHVYHRKKEIIDNMERFKALDVNTIMYLRTLNL